MILFALTLFNVSGGGDFLTFDYLCKVYFIFRLKYQGNCHITIDKLLKLI